MARADRPAYPTLRDGAVTLVTPAHYADTVYRDGTVVTTYKGKRSMTYQPGDDTDFAVRAREAAADLYN